MDTNMTFRMDSDIKTKMAEICAKIGMSQSTAFNIFANAFVREKGMPFPVTLEKSEEKVSRTKMLADADTVLNDFADDYKRMAE